MKKTLGILAIVLACSYLPAHATPNGCDDTSWIAGLSAICSGTLIYRDFIYDDTGSAEPNFDPEEKGSARGIAVYDVDINSADLVALRLSVVGGDLHVSFELNTMYNPDSTVAALAIDTDNNATTGGGAWADLLAYEDVNNGNNLPLVSDGWDEIHLFESGDPASNRIEGIIPLPAGNTWRLQAVTGIKSRRVVMNVAFRQDNETSYNDPALAYTDFFEARQAAALATGDISEFGYVVDVSKLTGGVTEPAPTVTGYHERIYTSAYTVYQDPATEEIFYDQNAEGVDHDGIIFDVTPNNDTGAGIFDKDIPHTANYLGSYQPYAIYIPQDPGPHGMMVILHGAGGSHNSRIASPILQQQMGDDYNILLVSPLARGGGGFYTESAERDVIDVMDDAEARYPVDKNRVFGAGYSMGGYGVHRMAHFYPDRFAGYIDWNGWAYTRAHNRHDTLRNTRYVPLAALYGGADISVSFHGHYLPLEQEFTNLGYESKLYLHPAGTHTSLHGDGEDRRKEAAYLLNRTRETQPAQVIYRSIPAAWAPALNIIHDGAYWVSEMRGHNTTEVTDFVDVDLLTYGCGGSLPVTNFRDDETGTDPEPWTAKEFEVVGETVLPVENRIEGTLANVASVIIDSSFNNGACLGAEPVEYEITTDAAGTITLSDGREIVLPGPGTWTGATEAGSNQDPDAVDDSAQTRSGESVTVDVLANDTDADGDDLSVTSVGTPANGAASDNGDGTITYTSDATFSGTDSFTYTVSDNAGGSDSATVTITVLAPEDNEDPVAHDDEAETLQDEAVVINVTANDTDSDGDALTVTAVTQPDDGSVFISSMGSVTYTPDTGFNGTDSFDYTVSDGYGGEDEATVSVLVASAEGTTDGRVHGSGHLHRGSSDKYDKIDFSFDAKFDDKKGLKGKLKLHDKDLDLKVDAKTITSLSTGVGETCDGELMDGVTSFTFTAVGELEVDDVVTEDVTFHACGVDNGKHGKGKDDQAPDRFHVTGGGYSTGERTPDSDLDGGNVHLHDPIVQSTPDGGQTTSSSSNDEPDNVAVIELDPMLVSEAPAGTPLALIATAHTPSGNGLVDVPMVLTWETDTDSGTATALTDALGIAVFTVQVPSGDVTYTATSGIAESNAVRVTGF